MSDGNRRTAALSDARGMTLVELLVAVVILTVTLFALAAATGVTARQVDMGREDTDSWMALQTQVETLIQQGYDDLVDGSAEVNGHPIRWTVAAGNPKKVLIMVERWNTNRRIVEDTLLFYLAEGE
jgi:prepilin-type N-terminal cleavage/methylation domain-containing protein